MAINALSSPSVTYQGSVSGTSEVSKTNVASVTSVSAEASAGSEVSERPSAPEPGKKSEMSAATVQIGREERAVESPQGTEALKRAVEEINKNAKNSEAVFGIHDKTNRVTIKIVDKETKEVIKEFPPEKTLDMIAKVWEMAGLMVDEKR